MKLKTIKKLNENETQEYAKKEWAKPKMQDFVIKKYDFYKTEDNLILEIEKANTLSITKALYYDDETVVPKVNFENFCNHNKCNCDMIDCLTENIKTDKKLYFCEQTKNLVSIIGLTDWDCLNGAKNRYFVIRELTADEQSDILQLYKDQKLQYLTRLEKYFKKYSNKIYTCGYWANY